MVIQTLRKSRKYIAVCFRNIQEHCQRPTSEGGRPRNVRGEDSFRKLQIYRILRLCAFREDFHWISIDFGYFFTPDVSGSFSLTNRTLVMFLDVSKTYGDVFARFVKFCAALQIPAAHQVDAVIICYKML